jgi:hypothetical protein
MRLTKGLLGGSSTDSIEAEMREGSDERLSPATGCVGIFQRGDGAVKVY